MLTDPAEWTEWTQVNGFASCSQVVSQGDKVTRQTPCCYASSPSESISDRRPWRRGGSSRALFRHASGRSLLEERVSAGHLSDQRQRLLHPPTLLHLRSRAGRDRSNLAAADRHGPLPRLSDT